MDRRSTHALLLATCMLIGCDSDRRPSAEHGTGGAGHSGMSNRGNAGGSGVGANAGVVVANIRCGSARCAASATLAACCVDPATSTCGVEDKAVGIACGVPAVTDPRCPPVNVDFAGTTITFEGCCTAGGLCGGSNLGSPCAVVAAADDDAGVRSTAAARCD